MQNMTCRRELIQELLKGVSDQQIRQLIACENSLLDAQLEQDIAFAGAWDYE